MSSPLDRFGLPPDAASWAALAVAGVLLAAALFGRRRVERLVERVPSGWAVAALALTATALSAAYVAWYLRGAPRIIDATSYYLEARALARGWLAIPLEMPTGSFRGRFLLGHATEPTMSVIFPPGYPAVLALGFLLKAPMLIGPAIAAALVVATYVLARRVFGRTDVALLAAAIGTVCAALRYHTADTMSHAWAALLLSTALAAALSAGLPAAALSGLACGWLLATRPVTGMVAVALVVAIELSRSGPAQERARRLGLLALAASPGIALLLAHHHAATGRLFGSPQLAYYALADGPPGCFRYGFGDGVGCRFEHGDFVREHLPDGYGLSEAVGTTLRRLRHHALDIANAEPLALILPYAAYASWRIHRARALVLGSLGLVIAYAPFYFDGNYPGGGARLFAEALPLEHVLVAWGLTKLRVARFGIPLALAGFALHASYAHRALADREGGRPMFERSTLVAAGVDRGLVFVTTDHGFNLGFDPGAFGGRGPMIARTYGDARDTALWEALGKPPAFVYEFDPFASAATPRLSPYEPNESRRFEAEGEWPLLSVAGGWAHPTHVGVERGCQSNRQGLRLRARGGGQLEATLELAPPRRGLYRVVTHWVAAERGPLDVESSLNGRSWGGRAPVEPGRCAEWPSPPLELPATRTPLILRARGENAVLDFVTLRPVAGGG